MVHRYHVLVHSFTWYYKILHSSGMKFVNVVVAPAMLFNLYTMALTKVQLESIDVLKRQMLRSIVGRAPVNGEDWFETMRLMNHSPNVVLEFFAIAPWMQQPVEHQFQLAAKVALEQSWSSMVGHWNFTSGWQGNFDNMRPRKRGRPLLKWDANLAKQFFPLHHGWPTAAKIFQNARQFFVSHFVDP